VLFLIPIICRLARRLCFNPLIILGGRHIHGSRAEHFTGPGLGARTATAGKYHTTHQGQGGDFHGEIPYTEKLSTL
jgi:hypothetical protein